MTVIDLILELCKYPAEMEVCTRYWHVDPDWLEYQEPETPWIEEGKVIIE